MENWLILRLIFAGLVFATKFPGVTVGSLRGFLTWMLLEFVHVFFLDSPLLLLKSSQPKRRPRGENLPSCPHKEGWRQVEGLGFLQNDYFRFISFKGTFGQFRTSRAKPGYGSHVSGTKILIPFLSCHVSNTTKTFV